MPARNITFNKEEYWILTGADLIKTAVDDWQAFDDDDLSLIEWFPELSRVKSYKKYKVWSELQFEEIEGDDEQ